jgi:putative nucleotidyltransferase with HDIG domain
VEDAVSAVSARVPSAAVGRLRASRRDRRISAEHPGALLRLVETARKNLLLYPAGHPQTSTALRALSEGLTGVLTEQPSIRFDIYESAFFHHNRLLLEESLHTYGLLADLTAQGVGSVEFLRGITPEEAARFIGLLAAIPEGQALVPTAQEMDLPHVRLGPPRALMGREREELEIDPRDVYRVSLKTVDSLNYNASVGAPLNLRDARLLVTSMLDVILRDRYALLGVAALRQHDEDTVHHCVNVAVLALMVGFRIGLDQPSLGVLGGAALLHDIGKMRIPRHILVKPERLAEEERELINLHPLYGAELLRHLTGPAHLAAQVALEHHMDFDLSGYPRVPSTRQPHLFSRIIAIADFFDAMTSARRTYRRPLLPDRAMRQIVLAAGTRFDPVLAKVFLNLLGAYPVGSVLELSSGEIAIAYRPVEGAPLRPLIKIVRDAAGNTIDPVLVELAKDPRRVVRCLDPTVTGINPADYL